MMDRVRLNEETGIPLFLLPHAIARQIKKTGDRIYRISVKRTDRHYYSVSIRTKSLPRELMPRGQMFALARPSSDCRQAECAKGGDPS